MGRMEMSPPWEARRLQVQRGMEMCQIWKVKPEWRIERPEDADFRWPGLIPGTFGDEHVTGLLNTKLCLIHPRLLAMPQAVREPIPPKVRCPGSLLSGPRTHSFIVRECCTLFGQPQGHSISRTGFRSDLETSRFPILLGSTKILSLGVLSLVPSLLSLGFLVSHFSLDSPPSHS